MSKLAKKTDSEIQQDVINEIKWDPSVSCSDVSVTAVDGIVTLRGNVPHYSEKKSAEAAAQRVGGVRAVADELEVNIMGSYERSDTQIAEAALSALNWSYSAPKGTKVVVEKGWVTLIGEADWDYQRKAAKDAVGQLMGVCGVTNNISLKSKVQPADVKSRIEDALKRSAESEASKIRVSIKGTQVTLAGSVQSRSELEDAGLAAYMAPGILLVENNLTVTQ